MAGVMTSDDRSDERLITVWLPRRSLAAVGGQLLLILAIMLIVIGIPEIDVPLLSNGWGISLGLVVAVLGANCLNFAYWYPIIWTEPPSSHLQSTLFTNAQRFMVRANITLQFSGCVAIILLQGVLAGIILSAPATTRASNLATFGAFLCILPALLGGVLDYILAQETRQLTWPPTMTVQPNQLFRGKERTAWLTTLGAARETYKLVIAIIVPSLVGGILAGAGQEVLLIAAAALTLLLILPMLWSLVVEARHLFRTQATHQ
jgi:hypothetical protein